MGALSCGVVHHPVIGETRCGDAYAVIDRTSFVLVAVVDGLGHGPEAEAAAKDAIAHIEAHAADPPAVLLEGCHRALRGTRGAVVAIARYDRQAKTLAYCGLGNIEARIVGAERVYRPISINGIVGHQARKLRVEEFPFGPGDLLIMHSDGISDRFEVSIASRGRDLQMLANQIVREHGRLYDDQVLLILRDEP